MSSFSRVEIDKLNINWDEIYRNKSDAKNNTNNVTANQDYWGDQEGLSVEIHDDGTVLIYEGDTPMGWTTLEALGLDENGNQAIMDYSELTADDIPEGQYVACTNENGIEGYAVLVDGALSFIPKKSLSDGPYGYKLFKWSDANGTSYIFIDENTGAYVTGLSEDEIESYAKEQAYEYINSTGKYIACRNENGIKGYEIIVDGILSFIPESSLYSGCIGSSYYKLFKWSDANGTSYININLNAETYETGLSEGEIESYAKNQAYVLTNEDGMAMVVQKNEIQAYTPEEQFYDGYFRIITKNGILTYHSNFDPKIIIKSETVDDITELMDFQPEVTYDADGNLADFTYNNITYTKTSTGYERVITDPKTGENYTIIYDELGRAIDMIDDRGSSVAYRSCGGLLNETIEMLDKPDGFHNDIVPIVYYLQQNNMI